MSAAIRTDGSANTDAHPIVTIDVSDPAERWRYRCPNGHAGKAWTPTNNHLFCTSCRRQMDHDPSISPEHYELLDTKTGESIPFSAIEFVGA